MTVGVKADVMAAVWVHKKVAARVDGMVALSAEKWDLSRVEMWVDGLVEN